MSNPFDQFVAPRPEGAPPGNPFDTFDASPVVDEAGQDVISRTNNPNVETPESFGFIETAPSVARGLAAYVASTPQAVGNTLIQQGELAGDGNVYTNRIIKLAQKENFNLIDVAINIFGAEKDAVISAFATPEDLKFAGANLVSKNEKMLQAAGLVRPEDGLGKYGFDIGQATGSLASSVGLTMLTKSPKYAASFQGLLINSQDYKEARKAGKTPEEASYIAATSATGQAALESFGGRYFLNVAATSGALKKVVIRAAGQGAEESTQATWEAAVKNTTGVRNQTWTEALADIGYQGALGFIVGAPVSAVAGAFEKSAVEVGIPEADAKKMAAEFVKHKNEIVAETAQILHNEASGVAVDKNLQNKSVEAMKQVIAESVQTEAAGIAIKESDNPQLAAETVLKSPDVTDSAKQAIKALPEGFTMQQLQDAIESKVNLPLEQAQAIKTKAEASGGVVSNDGAIIKYSLLESENSFAVEKTIENRDGSVETSVTQYPTAEEAKAAIAEATAAPKLTVEQIAGNLASVAAKSEAAGLGATAAKRKFYEAALTYKAKPKKFETTKEVAANIKQSLDKALAPISTRIRNINPKIAQRLNKFEQDYRLKTIEAKKAVVPFLEKMGALDADVQKVLDLAMKNGDVETINNIATQYDMVKELQAVRDTLDDIYKRAKEVDFDIGFRKNFYPRTVRDSKKLLAHFEKTAAWDDIAQAIRTKELETGKIFTVEEKAHLINTLLRGYKTAGITLAKPGALKERSIEQVTPEIMDFYYPVSHSIGQYIETVNESIEARKFFGKPAENISDSIGAYVLDEMSKGNLTGSQAAQLSDLLKARFSQGKMNSLLQAYKNLSYIDTMGSPISAITQISGLAFSLSNNGFYNTSSALFGKTKIQLDDIGISDIAAEFSEPGRTSRWVKWTFDKVGLSALDKLDKTVFINSTLSRYQKLAKSNEADLRSKLEPIFEGETDATIAALKEGKNTENVKLLLFNELTAMQPITLSEMPEMYLNHPNGRIFYMLKTFTLKQYDVYRRQVYQEIASGNTLQGLKNLTRLAFFMTLMNAGADAIKDLLLGRDTPMEDQVATNIARLFGFSKYQVYSVKKEGLGTAGFKTIAPPFKLVDSVSKDLTKKETPDIEDLKTIESIPIAGKFWYWWFGGGDKPDKPKYK